MNEATFRCADELGWQPQVCRQVFDGWIDRFLLPFEQKTKYPPMYLFKCHMDGLVYFYFQSNKNKIPHVIFSMSQRAPVVHKDGEISNAREVISGLHKLATKKMVHCNDTLFQTPKLTQKSDPKFCFMCELEKFMGFLDLKMIHQSRRQLFQWRSLWIPYQAKAMM